MSEARYEFADQPDTCPACGSDRVVPIVYGMLAGGPPEAAESDHAVFGGCCISRDSPAWACLSCKERIHRTGGSPLYAALLSRHLNHRS